MVLKVESSASCIQGQCFTNSATSPALRAFFLRIMLQTKGPLQHTPDPADSRLSHHTRAALAESQAPLGQGPPERRVQRVGREEEPLDPFPRQPPVPTPCTQRLTPPALGVGRRAFSVFCVLSSFFLALIISALSMFLFVDNTPTGLPQQLQNAAS